MRIASKKSKKLPKEPKGASVVVFVVVGRCLSASRLFDFSPKNRQYLYPANSIFRTFIEPVLHVSENFNFRREKYLSLLLNYHK